MEKNGRILVYTGDGKGKTSAALGTAFRALGHGHKVCVIQFLKGKGEYGERIFARTLDAMEWHVCGKGFVFNKEDLTDDRQVAEEGFSLAWDKVMSDCYDLVILDELTYLPLYDFLNVERIVDLMRKKPARLSLVITGRNAHDAIVAEADTVTSMEVVKHAFAAGIKAQKGIEF